VPEFIHPGVFVEEVPSGVRSIEGVSTSTAGFVGVTAVGPTDGPVLVSSIAEFERSFGDEGDLRYAAQAFFAQGGTRLFVQRVGGPDECEAGLRALGEVPEIAVVAAPGASVAKALVEHAERMRYRFAILDCPRGQTVGEVTALREEIDSSYAALYYPWVMADEIARPPSGFVAGVYARNDANRGVFKAPANEPVEGAVGLERTLSDHDAEALSSRGINALRVFEDGGVRVWGARTVSSDPEWKYVNVRRYFVYLEHSIDRGTQWTVFEPNGEKLWATMRATLSDFLLTEFRGGALAGNRPDDAFFVKCDRTTMTQDDLDNGRLVCVVGVAPLRPAEFVIIHIARWTADHPRDLCSE
jgi:phage tail sheath protein FI